MDTIMTRANGFLVTGNAAGVYDYWHCDTLDEAMALYQEPPSGYRATGIAACKDGKPFADLQITGRVQIFRPEPVVVS